MSFDRSARLCAGEAVPPAVGFAIPAPNKQHTKQRSRQRKRWIVHVQRWKEREPQTAAWKKMQGLQRSFADGGDWRQSGGGERSQS